MANTRAHRYTVSLTWTGNLGSGTSGYRDYSRDYEIGAEGKPVIHGSADPAFRGDRSGRLSGGHRDDKSRRPGKGAGAGYGEEIPDAAL